MRHSHGNTRITHVFAHPHGVVYLFSKAICRNNEWKALNAKTMQLSIGRYRSDVLFMRGAS